jgi:putative MATE family efflux protein
METMMILIVSEMADALCGLIDAIFISRYLGSTAIAAHGVSVPVFTLLCIFSYILATGIQHQCIVSIGKGKPQEANGYYNMAIFSVIAICLVLTAIGLFLPDWSATMLGAGNGEIRPLAAAYIRGVAPGTLPLVLFLVVVPMLQIDGKWAMVHIGSVVMAVSDVLLDYLNIFVFNGGMYGMGMATSISYTLGLVIFLFYFADKKRLFHIRPSDMKGLSYWQFISTGLPAGTRMVARMLSLVIINVMVISLAGTVAMAAMAVQRNISSLVISAVIGLGGAVLSITSISYGKQDKDGLRDAVRLGYRHSFGVMAVFATALFFTAPLVASLYLERADESFPLAVKALRWLAASMPMMAWNWSFGSYLHGIGYIKQSAILFVVEELVLLCLIAWIMSLIWGVEGIFASFAVSQLIILVLIWVSRYRYRHRH